MADGFFREPHMPAHHNARREHERFLLDTYADRRDAPTRQPGAALRRVLHRIGRRAQN